MLCFFVLSAISIKPSLCAESTKIFDNSKKRLFQIYSRYRIEFHILFQLLIEGQFQLMTDPHSNVLIDQYM